MDTIWIVALVVIALLLVALVAVALNKKKTEGRRVHAEELRGQAASQAGTMSESQRQTQEAEAEAQIARAEAERAEQKAAESEQGLQVDQARHEDAHRQADRVDPDVDHKSDDYTPGATQTAPATGDTSQTPTTRDPDDTSETDKTPPGRP